MTWKYRATRAADLDALLDQLNKAGAEGWEVVSVTYARDTTETVTVGAGTMERPGPAMWVAILKREEAGLAAGL
jgi:hypothetical protein